MTCEQNAPVLIERQGPVLLVTLNRPAVSNALDPVMLRGLLAAWRAAAAPDCHAVVIAGAGRNFCAGADLAAAMSEPGAMDLREAFHPQYLALAALDKPVIAAVNGAAAGGGLGLALAADLRIAGEGARFVPGWVRIGLVPDLGASWFAVRLVGQARAFDWFTSGDALGAAEALAWGVVNAVVPDAELLPRALERAHRLAEQPGLAVPLTKKLLAGSTSAGLADQLEAEVRCQAAAIASPQRAAQVEKRMTSFAKER